MGANFCAEFMNVEGNGKGKHRSFIRPDDEVYWMGMEDLLAGGDHDCNDVIFGVVSDLKIWMPSIVDPALKEKPDEPGPEELPAAEELKMRRLQDDEPQPQEQYQAQDPGL